MPPPITSNEAPWQTANVPLDKHHYLSYRVPYDWAIDNRRRARNRDDRARIEVEASYTTLRSSELSLASYAAQLAEGEPVYRVRTPTGDTAYLTTRAVSLAPSDPHAEQFMFHTAVVDIDGRIAKLEATYDAQHRWRFEELCTAIVGTIDVIDR
jgi:hypothetical protein